MVYFVVIVKHISDLMCCDILWTVVIVMALISPKQYAVQLPSARACWHSYSFISFTGRCQHSLSWSVFPLFSLKCQEGSIKTWSLLASFVFVLAKCSYYSFPVLSWPVFLARKWNTSEWWVYSFGADHCRDQAPEGHSGGPASLPQPGGHDGPVWAEENIRP